MNNKKAEYFKEKLKDTIQDFIDDELFHTWDDLIEIEFGDITREEQNKIEQMFEINIDVVYKGPR